MLTNKQLDQVIETKCSNPNAEVNELIRNRVTGYNNLDAYDQLDVLRQIYRDVLNAIDTEAKQRQQYIKRAQLNEIRTRAYNIRVEQEFIVLVGLYQRAKLMEDIQLLESTWNDITRIRPLVERSDFIYEEL